MAAAARIRDKSTGNVRHHNGHLCPDCCSGHGVSGGQEKGSSKLFIEQYAQARVGDSGWTSCPCCGQGYKNTKGSDKFFVEGAAAARVGDEIEIHGVGVGKMSSGSSKVFINK